MEVAETLAQTITSQRKRLGLTQEQLAQELGVTFQAVSKWENQVCCPDVGLLPRLARCLDTSMDALFGQAPVPAATESALPWPDDSTLRVVLYQGHQLLSQQDARDSELIYRFEGPVLNVESQISVTCGDVAGNVTAGGGAGCGQVGGSVAADGGVHCDLVSGNVQAGGGVNCDYVGGNVVAGASINCDSIGGDASAGCNIQCDTIQGDAQAQTITCDNIQGKS